MREFVRRTALGLGAASLLCAWGCGKGLEPTGEVPASRPAAKDVRIGFIVKMPDEKWFQDEWKFARKCADKNGFKLLTIGATDGEKVISAIDNLAVNGAQGFVICTPDVKLGPAIMAKAKSHNMKVYSVDDQFVGPDGKFMDTPYMGISARKIGETVGEALVAQAKKLGWNLAETGACAVTFDELNTSKERTSGATDVLVKAGLPRSQVFAAPERTTDVPGAHDAASVLLTQHPEVKRWLVYSVNDEGVMGAVRAMESRGFTPATCIGVGIGGPSSFGELANPKQTPFFGTVMLSPYRHGYETTELMFKWIVDGVEPPKDTRTAGIFVDRTNYRRIAGEQGLLD
jgi:L-arabinose transport system substrate-binding protein